jgi:hypothetical protein
MNNFHIVTSANEKYKNFLYNFSKNIQTIFKIKPYVYDLGLSQSTKHEIKANFINININYDFFKINNYNCINTIHKPDCIIDFIHKTQKPFIFIDIDCLFTTKFKFPQSDITFTFKHYCEQTISDFNKNGIINAGVIFFLNNYKTKHNLLQFLTLWRNFCFSDPNMTDQMALSNILSKFIDINTPLRSYSYMNLTITLLESEFYNDIKCRTGYIFHFKSAARSQKKFIKYQRYNYLIKHYNLFIKLILLINRLLLILKRLFKPKRYQYRYKKTLSKYLQQIKLHS